MPESEPFDRISTDYVTPHVNWAKPFVNGKLKVLVLASLMRHRETVELYQRLDMDFDTMIASGPNEFVGEYFFLTEDETLKLNMSKLAAEKQYDVIIIAVSWFILPNPLKLEISRRIKAGTGALFTESGGYSAFMASAGKLIEAEEFRDVKVKPGAVPVEHEPDADEEDELDFVNKEEPASALPALAGKFIRLSMTPEAMMVDIKLQETSFGKGRVVSVYGVGGTRLTSSTPPLSPKVGMEGKLRRRVLYEFHMAHLAKAVVYTARKEPKAAISRLRVKEGNQSPEGTPQGLTVELSAKRAMPGAEIDLLILDELRRVRLRRQQPVDLRVGSQTVKMDLPLLPEGGKHFVVVRLLQNEKVVSWDAESIEPRAANGVERFVFQSFYKSGELVRGTVMLRGSLTESQTLTLELTDNFERVLFRQTAKQGKAIVFAAPTFNALAPLHRIRARIQDKESLVYDYDHEFLVGMDAPDNYTYVVWTDSAEYYYRQILMDRYYDLGVTACMTAATLPSSNLRPWPYLTHLAQWREGVTEKEIRIQKELGEAVRQETTQFDAGGLDDKEEKIDAALDLEGIKSKRNATKSIGPIGNPCFNDPVWAAQETERLQKAARDLQTYSPVGYSLGDENQVGLTCHSEHCIRVYRKWLKNQFENLDVVNSRYDAQFKAWDEVMWPAFQETKDAPGKLVAWYDRQRFTDWTFNNAHLICKNAIQSVEPNARVGFSGFFNPQPERGVDALRNFPWATFNNQYQDTRWEDQMRAFSPRNAHLAVIQGTYSGYKHPLEFVCYPWLEFFRGATGKMWWRGQYFKDAMSCLDPGYSPLPPFNNTIKMANEVRRGLFHLIREFEFQNYGIRVLYSMPDMYAAYVKDQDKGPANWLGTAQGMYESMRHRGWQYDYLSTDQIEQDELRSVKLLFLPGTECLSPAMAQSIRAFVQNGGTLVADIVPGTRAMSLRPLKTSLLADLFDGLATGQSKREGRGHVFFSGDLLQRGKWEEESTRKLVNAITYKSGANRHWELLQSDGNPVTGWELSTYKNGQATIMAIVAGDARFNSEPAEYTLKLSQAATVYDVREKKALGSGTSFNFELSPESPKVLAALPQPMGSLQARLVENVYQAGDKVRLQIELNPSPDCVTTCFVEVSGPDGRSLRHYAKPVILKDGKAEFVWDSALGDKGNHKFIVTETLSAQQTELQVVLK